MSKFEIYPMSRYVEEQMRIFNSFQQYFIIVFALFFLIIFACRGQHVIPEASTEPPPGTTGQGHRFIEEGRQDFLADRHFITEGLACKDCHGTESPGERASVEQCLKCHGSYEDVAALTEHLSMNPHRSHYGVIQCVLCHKSHEKSSFYCNTCHFFDVEVP